jgi:MOSC domain-containing protein YiiM
VRQPRLLSIQTGKPADHGTEGAPDPTDRPWITGFFKTPVSGPLFLRTVNLDGDGQADLVNHGGPDKAVCAYPAGHYDAWRRELGLPEMPFGGFGENFTVGGLTEAEVCIGDVWRVGGALVQVSQPRQPCWKLARRWRIKDLPGRVVETGRTGWYFRVLQEGAVSLDLPMTLVERPVPHWSVGRANRVMHHDKSDVGVAAELASVRHLSASWKEALSVRANAKTAS